MQTASIIKDLLLSIAAIVTMFVALYGLNAWRKELKGKTEYEIARTYPTKYLQSQSGH